jgi:hypothetical protein
MKFISGVIVGLIIGSLVMNHSIKRDNEKQHTGYVWSNLVEVPDDRSGADTWFQQEYDSLEWSWQRMVDKYDHMDLPDGMAADVITTNYLPWTQELLDETNKRDLPQKQLKTRILKLRIQSLKSLEAYYTEYKEEDFDSYSKYDTEFRQIISEHSEVFE